jgi:ribosomal protein S18 acetylase RimI-like enzyme
MVAGDVERVMEITCGLPEAPQWSAAAWRSALEPEGALRRVALVVESFPFPSKIFTDTKNGENLPELEPSAQQKSPGPDSHYKTGPGRVFGLTVASFLGFQAELELIAVSTEAQRQGVARRLWAALAGDLAGLGVTEVLLEVRQSNRAARGLYDALGFRQAGIRPRYYADPVEDAVLMTVRLP